MKPASLPLSRRDALRCLGLAGLAALVARPSLVAQDKKPTAPVPARNPAHYRFRIGEIEAFALSDGGIVSDVAKPVWGGSDTAKMIADLEAAAMPTDKVELPFTVLLLHIGPEWVLIDAGSGPLFGATAGCLPASLAAAGVTPAQITGIVITHAHSDHFGGLLDAVTLEPLFPNAKLFIHRREYDYWTSPTPDVSQMLIPEKKARGMFPKATAYLTRLKDKWQFIAPGDKLIGGLEIIDAPGHTPGHIALMVSSGKDQLLHFVDAVHHHALSFANPDWCYLYDSQPKLAVVTRKRLVDRAAADRLRLFGAHMPFPGLGRVRAVGKHYEHIIEPWSSLMS